MPSTCEAEGDHAASRHGQNQLHSAHARESPPYDACAEAWLTVSAAFVFIALLAAPIAAAPEPTTEPNAATEPTSVTIADDTFGEGGTRQSFSNAKHEVNAEVWRDKNGIVREQFEIAAGGEQLWGFFNGTGEGEPASWRRSMIAVRPMDRPSGRFQMWVIAADNSILKEMSTLSKDELDTRVRLLARATPPLGQHRPPPPARPNRLPHLPPLG